MIAEITLKNFRGFESHTVPLDQFTLLVGKNNAGKSTVVEALRLISIITQRFQGLNYKPLPSWAERPKRERGVFPATSEFEFNTKSIFHRLGDPPAEVTACFSSGHKVHAMIGPDAEVVGIITEPGGGKITDKSSALRSSLPRVNILPSIGPLLREERRLQKDYVMHSLSSQRASLHFRNQLHFIPEHLQAFRALAESSWPKLQVKDLVQTQLAIDEYKLDLLVREGDFTAEVGWMGHGLQMWLQTMWFLTHSIGADVVVLDEPDVYMHADLQRRLVRMLRQRPHQSVIATHSVEIMSEVSPSEIVVIDRARNRSGWTDSAPAVQSLLQNIGSIHNIHLARLTAAKRVVLVEGDDMDFLKPLQDVLFPNTATPIDTLPNRSLGGWTGWERAQGLAMLLRDAGDSIKLYCILDSDYHADEAILKRYGQAMDARINLHIWRRKELENYLLVPEAIQRVIAKGTTKGKPPSVSQVQSRLDELTLELKDDVFDSFADEFNRLDRSRGVKGANQKAKEHLRQRCETPIQRLERVSGKELIHKLSSWAKSSFGSQISAVGLARNIMAHEMPSELKDVLFAIEHSRTFQNDGSHHGFQ